MATSNKINPFFWLNFSIESLNLTSILCRLSRLYVGERKCINEVFLLQPWHVFLTSIVLNYVSAKPLLHHKHIFLTRPAADITAITDVIHYHNKVIYLS